MAESKPVTIRIPDAWLSKIEDLAAQKYPGRKGNPNKSQVVLDAIEFYLQHLNDTENKVHTNDTVLNVNKISIQYTVNLAVEKQIKQLTLNLKQALSHCFTTFTDVEANQVEALLEKELVISKLETESLEPDPLPKSQKSQVPALQSETSSNKPKFDERTLTRNQMYQYLGISSRTLDLWIRKAKLLSDPPIISHQGKTWRYILSGKGLRKVFVLIEDEPESP